MCDGYPTLFWNDAECSGNPGIDSKESTVPWTGIECSRELCLHLTVVRVLDVIWGSF